MTRMDDIFFIVIPILLVMYLILWSYMLVNDYKKQKARKREAMLDMIPCLCGHTRWIHWPHDEVSTCHDFKWEWDRPCPCNKYRMDNLVYLERVGQGK